VTTLLLARHGETDWNRELRIQGSSDIGLNDLGRRQAQALAQELEHVDLDAVYSSDLSRARETAAAVAALHGLEVRLDPRLRERAFGSWEGLTREDIAALPEGSRHDGEDDDAVRERVLEAIQAIADAHPGENVLVVAHGGALNVLWHHAIGERVERWANCAVYRLEVREDGYVPVD
jgi:probable phosphoglycerate mutase